jgi:hypothetical protein
VKICWFFWEKQNSTLLDLMVEKTLKNKIIVAQNRIEPFNQKNRACSPSEEQQS